jgi:hypothetical protein
MEQKGSGMNRERIDFHLDAILKASGSALKHYTIPLNIERMRDALRAAIAEASSPHPSPLAQKPNEQSIASAYESVERTEYASRDDA